MFRERFWPPMIFFKKELLIHRFTTALFWVADFVSYLCTDNMVLWNCSRLPRCSLVGFSFIISFTKHMICSHSLFIFFRLGTVLDYVVWWSTSAISFPLSGSNFHNIHWIDNNEILCFPSVYNVWNILVLYYSVYYLLDMYIYLDALT